MKKILLLNGGKQFAHSDGRYNATLHDAAVAFLDRAGCDVKTTFIDGGYDIEEEVQKFLWADVVIYQMPGWWMGAPWTVKKYLDEVFTAGHGSLYANDGRTRADASQKYGSGGLIQGKQYPLEVHLVHSDPDGNLAVVGLMFEQGAANPLLATLWQQLPQKAGDTLTLSKSVNVADLLPKDHSYYRFAGSLTTPPCTDPGPFVYTPTEVKPLEQAGAHSPAATAATPPVTTPQTQAEVKTQAAPATAPASAASAAKP